MINHLTNFINQKQKIENWNPFLNLVKSDQ